MSMPRELRALAVVMRLMEQDGEIESTPDLGRIVAASGFSTDDIDYAFELLVADDGSTVGGSAELAELNGSRIGALVLNGMIEIGDGGSWLLTPRGEAFSNLLDEYAKPERKWRKRQAHEGTSRQLATRRTARSEET